MLINLFLLSCPNKSSEALGQKKNAINEEYKSESFKKDNFTLKNIFIGDSKSVNKAREEFIDLISKNDLLYKYLILTAFLSNESFYKITDSPITKEEIIIWSKEENIVESILEIIKNIGHKDAKSRIENAIQDIAEKYKELKEDFNKILSDNLKEYDENKLLIINLMGEKSAETLINVFLLFIKTINIDLAKYTNNKGYEISSDLFTNLIPNPSRDIFMETKEFLKESAEKVAEKNNLVVNIRRIID